ncbi:sensor histidine kinase [Candidatus Saccharibacteria bacterium]|nr:sensor histidine kinase [Candidatus Saccharibacteria bacterium]
MVIMLMIIAYSLLLAGVIITRNRHNTANISLVASIIIISLWAAGIYWLQINPGLSVLYTQGVFALGLFGMASLTYFVHALLVGMKIRLLPQSYVWMMFVIVAACALITVTTPWIIEGTVVRASGQLPIPLYGWFFWAYLFILLALAGIIGYLLYSGYEKARGVYKLQVRTVAISVVSAFSLAFMTNLVLPVLYKDTQYALFFPAAMVLLVTGMTYAIVRNGLFDIRTAAVRTVAYALSIATMAGVYFGFAYLLSLTLFRESTTTGFSVSFANILLALILALVFQPIKKFFDTTTNRIFFRNQYSTAGFVSRIGEVLTSTDNLNELLVLALKEVTTTLKASRGLFVLFEDNSRALVVRNGSKVELSEPDAELLKDLAHSLGQQAVIYDNVVIDDFRVAKMLARQRISVVLPLVQADEPIGCLLLGESLTRGYGRRDAKALEAVADELIIAIRNARSVREVRDINDHLQQRIAEATRELTRSNKRLIELDATKDEFVSMASHQLRTPLTSVKGYISMVLEGDAGEITKAQRQLLREAYTSSERMVHLIGDFLNVSRLQTGKFMLDRRQCDLAKITEQEVESIAQIAQAHGMQLTCHTPARFPLLYIDEGKVRQVIMNFIDNAIYYSPEHSPIKVTLSVEEGSAVLRVKDKGIGVPAGVQHQLFTKFFRAENARRQRPDGTGIGLYLSKRVVYGHGGSLIFESEVDKGSLFGFRLPIKKLSTPPPE